MKPYQANVKQASLLGQLLTAAGIIDVEVISEAYQAAKTTGMDMGRMLVSAGYLGQCDLRAALEAINEIEERRLTHDQAALAFKYSYDQCLPFAQAMEQTILTPITTVDPNLLGELLLASRLISEYQLAVAMNQAKDCGLTIGRIFVLTHVITVPMLESAVELLRRIRDGEFTLEKAAKILRMVVRKRIDVLDAIKVDSPDLVVEEARPRLGALLVKAGLVAEFDALNAAELAIEKGKLIGQVLHESGLISNMVLNAALKVQSLVADCALTLTQAHELLQQVQKLQVPIEDLLKELSEMKKKVTALLVRAGIISELDVRRAILAAPKFNEDAVQALVDARTVPLSLIRDAARCTSLIDQGKLRIETACAALVQCNRDQSALEDVLKKLQVETSTRIAAVYAPALAGGVA